MNIESIIKMVTDFFSSIPWENVISGFIGSVQGVNWESLGKLFDGFDLSNGFLQDIIDFFQSLFA